MIYLSLQATDDVNRSFFLTVLVYAMMMKMQRSSTVRIEIRNLGLTDAGQLELEVARAFAAALDRFDERIRRVRVRLIPAGTYEAACRVRVWCGHGPTLVMEAHAASGKDAIHAVADKVNRALRSRWGTRRSRRRRADVRHSSSTSTSRKELS